MGTPENINDYQNNALSAKWLKTYIFLICMHTGEK